MKHRSFGSSDSSLPKAMVGTLYAGEREFPESIDASLAQEGVDVSLVVLANMPKAEAHQHLYRWLSDMRQEFQIRAKVDADMVIREPQLLNAARLTFLSHPSVDRITVLVRDWFTDADIDGMHMFGERMTWTTGRTSRLFTDGQPNNCRRTVTVRPRHAVLVEHAPNPSLRQSLAYGGHRILKALSRGPASHRWSGLTPLIETCQRDIDLRRRAAVGLILLILEGAIRENSLPDLIQLTSIRNGHESPGLERIIGQAEIRASSTSLAADVMDILSQPGRIAKLCDDWSTGLTGLWQDDGSRSLWSRLNGRRHMLRIGHSRALTGAAPDEVVEDDFHQFLRSGWGIDTRLPQPNGDQQRTLR